MIFVGNFALISPASLLQMLCQEQRSVTITAWRGQQEVVIQLDEGMVVGAHAVELGTEPATRLPGAAAVYHWLAWESGRFRIAMLQDRPVVQMTEPWEELVLEAARQRDEIGATLEHLPACSPAHQLAPLLDQAPALAGLALVGYDGRLLGATGLPEAVLQQAPTLAGNLAAAGAALNGRRAVALYVTGPVRLLVADWGQGIVGLAVPGADVPIVEASSQLADCGPAAHALANACA